MMSLEGKQDFLLLLLIRRNTRLVTFAEASPSTFLKINVLVVERQKLETLLVGHGVLSSLSSDDP